MTKIGLPGQSTAELNNAFVAYGPTPSGVAATDTAALQAASDALAARAMGAVTIGGTLQLKAGTYYLNTTWLFNQQALTIRGVGPATVIKWAGAAGADMISVTDSTRVEFADLTILGDATNVPASLIHFDTPTVPAIGTNEFLAVRRCSLGRRYTTEGAITANGASVVGILIGGTAVGNNDTWIVEDTQVYDCSTAGLSATNAQTIWSKVQNMLFVSCGVGLSTKANMKGRDLHFAHCTKDFEVLNSARLSIDGYETERAGQFGTTTGGCSLNIKRGKGLLQTEMASQPYYFDLVASNYGAIHIEDFLVTDSATTGAKLRVSGSSSNTNPASVHIHDCVLPNGDTDAGYVFDGYSAGTPLWVDVQQDSYRRAQVVQSLTAVSKFTPAASREDIGDWIQGPPIAASQSAVALNRVGQTSFTKRVMPRAGSITAVTAIVILPRTAGSLTLTVTKGGNVVSTTSVVIDGTATTSKTTILDQGVATFVAGDQIGFKVTTTSDWAPTASNVVLGSIEVTYA